MTLARNLCCLLPLVLASCVSSEHEKRAAYPDITHPPPPSLGHPDESCFVAPKKIYLRREVRFGYAKAALSESSERALDRLISEIKTIPVTALVEFGGVVGHTDSSGNASLNALLRRNRAKAVGDYLIQRGFPPNSIYYGEGRDLHPPSVEADNRTAAGRRANRRVDIEIVILEGVCPMRGYPHI
jgi:outer membrane protein OmpA-like peptidoglycan-associated protein